MTHSAGAGCSGEAGMCAESKRFGTPQAAESPSAQQGLRAGSQMPEGAFHADDGDVSLRSKLMHASKKVRTCTSRYRVLGTVFECGFA